MAWGYPQRPRGRISREFINAVRDHALPQYRLALAAGFTDPRDLGIMLNAEIVVLSDVRKRRLALVAKAIGFEGDIFSEYITPAPRPGAQEDAFSDESLPVPAERGEGNR